MKNLLQLYYKITHFLWLFGNLFIQILKFDIKEIKETYYWIIIHLTYKSSVTYPSKLPFKRKLVLLLYKLLGLLFLIIIFYILYNIIKYNLK